MLIEEILIAHDDFRSPLFIRRQFRATFRAERRANAPNYTRRVWLQEVRRALGMKLRDMKDRRQLALFA